MDRKEWLEWRRGGIGSSDAPIIMGVSPWSTPLQLWKDKVEGTPEKAQNAAMKRGTDLEPMIRDRLEDDFQLLLAPKNICHPDFEWMRSSLDAIDWLGHHIFEIKCPGKADHDTAMKGQVPEKYIPQLQHQLACACLPYMTYVSFYEGSYVAVKVERDEEYINILVEKEREFWDCVLNKTPPEKTSQDHQEKDSDPEWRKLVSEWRETYVSLKSCEEKEKILRAKIIEASGGASSVGGGVKLTRQECQGSIDYDRATTEYIQQIQQLLGDSAPSLDLNAYRKPSIQKFRLSIV
ncbi:MAG TPA: YqaJ viral recombinase family protein [Rhabdochlamydiaceae bacterium]